MGAGRLCLDVQGALREGDWIQEIFLPLRVAECAAGPLWMQILVYSPQTECNVRFVLFIVAWNGRTIEKNIFLSEEVTLNLCLKYLLRWRLTRFHVLYTFMYNKVSTYSSTEPVFSKIFCIPYLTYLAHIVTERYIQILTNVENFTSWFTDITNWSPLY